MNNIDESFRCWLEKKNRAYREARAAEQRQREREIEIIEQRRKRGQEAYIQWMKARLLVDEELYKNRIILRQQRKLLAEERMKKESRAQYEYNMWKHRKNTELKFELKHSKDSIVQTSRVTTPTLPGYCSVWSCDPHMTDVMLSQVKRPVSYTLTDYVT